MKPSLQLVVTVTVVGIIALSLFSATAAAAALSTTSSTSTLASVTEMNALRDLHIATRGDDWTWYPNETASGARWDFTKNASTGEYLYNPCGSDVNLQWQGITCSALPTVVRLDLAQYNLTGTLPDSVGQLSSLTFLQFWDNKHLVGSIPSAIGDLHKLQLLDFDICALTGLLPATMSKLTALEQFWASENFFSGQIPLDFGDLSRLQFINLFGNQFSGSLPSTLGKLRNMVLLGLDYNAMLTGTIPPELGQLTKMEILGISNCGFSGTIPAELAKLQSVGYFYLQSNMLTGTISGDLGMLVNSADFYLSNNALTGTIPPELGGLVGVGDLYMDANMFTGTVPIDLFDQFHSLEVLRLQRNLLTGDLTGRFGGLLPMLQNVDFSDNRLSGSLPDDVFELPNLLNIALTLNCFEGTLPEALCSPRNVTVLSLDGLGAAKHCKNAVKVPLTGVTIFNTLGGTIPECVWNLPQLQVLHLTGNGKAQSHVCRSVHFIRNTFKLFCVLLCCVVDRSNRKHCGYSSR